jgi:hypothetical protein
MRQGQAKRAGPQRARAEVGWRGRSPAARSLWASSFLALQVACDARERRPHTSVIAEAADADEHHASAPSTPTTNAALSPRLGSTPATETASEDAECVDESCCPVGSQTHALTALDDVLDEAGAGDCIVAFNGDDTVQTAGAHATTVVAGGGADLLWISTPGTVFAGAGDDEIILESGTAEVVAGSGDDLIVSLEGEHVITPGPGADAVYSGPGSIVLQISDVCDLADGEFAIADGAADVLVISVSLEYASTCGAAFTGFERVVAPEPTNLDDVECVLLDQCAQVVEEGP